MSQAALEPTFAPAGAPISVLLDFDGTISQQDVGDVLLERLVEDQAEVMRLDQLYDEGSVGSRELIRWDMEVLPHDAGLLRAEVARLGLDPTLAGLVDQIRSIGAEIEIVSDGIGFHIEEMLALVDLAELPVATNSSQPGLGAEGVTFPYGNNACFVCGTCKRDRVRRHQESDRAVIFVGDGTSDRYAAYHADIVFAKASLAAWCHGEGILYEPWQRLSDVAAWLEAALDDGRLPADAASYQTWVAQHRPGAPAFICGSEAWGEGRTVAPPNLDPSRRAR